MASIINALSSGTGGISTAGDASGILQLQTANTAAVTIDGSQNVGIGTASPGSGIRLDVLGGEIKAGRIDSSSEGGQVSFGRASDNSTAWYIDAYGNTSTPSLRFVDVGAGAVSVGINSSGAIALRGAASASGVGITFPATQSASSDANTLDDYEEGTFTPTIIGLTTAGTGTYGAQNGKYTKIGNAVTFSVDINWTAHTGTGNMAIAGLPFTAAPISFQRYPNSNYNQNINLSANNYMVTYVSDGQTRVTLAQLPTGGGAPSQVPMDTSGEMFVAGLYLT
jgi:hypothetical protein